MNRFTKLIAPALVASLALGAAVPATAAPFFNNGNSVRQQIVQLDRKVDQAARKHLITRQEAQRLERTVDQLKSLQLQYAKNGFTKTELRLLDQRVDTAERLIDRTIAERGPNKPGFPGGHGSSDHDNHGPDRGPHR